MLTQTLLRNFNLIKEKIHKRTVKDSEFFQENTGGGSVKRCLLNVIFEKE